MEDILQKIAQRENGSFEENEIKEASHGGSYTTISYYYLTLDYKEHHIELRNELGNSNTGSVKVSFGKKALEKFVITNRSHFWRLFNKKSNILKIKTVDSILSLRLEGLLEKSLLEHYSRENLFEPKIYNIVDGETMVLVTDYHLEFDDKRNITEALINFYKLFVDAIVERKI